MTKPALQKIYVILGRQDEQQLEGLCRAISGLFSYVNLTSNLYLLTESLPDGMRQVERIHKEASAFLRENLFARLYLHLVHPVSHAAMEETKLCYQYLKRSGHSFDQEGYMHQEVPRLMLLPVIVPGAHAEPVSLKGLLDALKGSFLPPSLYLDRATFSLAQDERLLSSTEKTYYGPGNSREMSQVVCNLYHQDILDDSSARLESEHPLMAAPCPAALILSAQDGTVYSCMDAFCKKESLADIYGNLSAHTLMDRYYEHGSSRRGCLGCRERVAESYADLPLPEGTRHEIGALLYHFGTLHQEAEEYAQAIRNHEKSLGLSPPGEAGPIFFRLGLGYTKTGRYDEAIEAFGKAAPACHGQYYFHFYTGLCYFQKGDYRIALEEFSKAVHLKPQGEDLVAILIYMGTCYNSLGEYEEALVPLERAKEAAGYVKEICSALGFSYFKLQDYDRAIENLGRAVEIDPHSAIDYASLGANYREKGDITMAIAMYEKALALDPSITSARENLEKLKGKP